MDIVYCIRYKHSNEVKIGYSHIDNLDYRMSRLRQHGRYTVICLLKTKFDTRLYGRGKNQLEKWLHRYFDKQRVFGKGVGGSQRPERFVLTDAELSNGIIEASKVYSFIECWQHWTLREYEL